jgi:hypothetical protein
MTKTATGRSSEALTSTFPTQNVFSQSFTLTSRVFCPPKIHIRRSLPNKPLCIYLVSPEFNFQPILTFISLPSVALNSSSSLHHRLSQMMAYFIRHLQIRVFSGNFFCVTCNLFSVKE